MPYLLDAVPNHIHKYYGWAGQPPRRPNPPDFRGAGLPTPSTPNHQKVGHVHFKENIVKHIGLFWGLLGELLGFIVYYWLKIAN